MGCLDQNLKMEKRKFINLLILGHLKSHFIKLQLTKFFMCFEINELKCLKLTILSFLSRPHIYSYYSNSSKNIFIVKTPFIIHKST